jgi:hypothetical protein
MLHSDGSSVHGGSLLLLGPGDPLGEMAFFTETPCFEVNLGEWEGRDAKVDSARSVGS